MDGRAEGFAQFAAFWGNSQYNPVSGGERMAEWSMGTQYSDPLRPSRPSGEERETLSKLEGGHPLRSLWNNLRDFTYYSNPAISHWTGSELKEATWLGRKVRRPDGIFRGEWPIGVPGVWEFNQGDYLVEATLEDLGMLDPPPMIMNGTVQGVMVTEAGRKQLNQLMGSYRAPDEAGAFSRNSRIHQNGLVFPAPQIQYSREDQRPGELPFTRAGTGKDYTKLIDDLVRDRTAREAMNALIQSPQWEKWRKEPADHLGSRGA